MTPIPSDGFWVSRNQYRPGLDDPSVYARIVFSEGGPYILKVYNTAGELIKTLRDGTSPSGVCEEVHWDGTNRNGEPVASGLYLFAFTNRTKCRTAKVLVVR